VHDGGPLLVVQIGEFAGRAERRQAVHTSLDQILDQPRQHIGLDAAVSLDGGNEIREDAVE
jgi:hypothetical protein